MGYKSQWSARPAMSVETLSILDERKFPADEGVAGAGVAPHGRGRSSPYGDRTLKVKALEHYPPRCRHPPMSAGGSVSKEWSPNIAAAGAVAIDNSSAWRMDPDVPPTAGSERGCCRGLHQEEHHREPNCSTAQLVVVLSRCTTRLSSSASWSRPISRCWARQGCDGRTVRKHQGRLHQRRVVTKKFPKRIAFNVIPQIDVFMEDGYTKEKWKMMMETKKILDRKIKLLATCVRVPVFVGHSEAATLSSRRRSRRTKRATSCATRLVCPCHRQARSRAATPRRMRPPARTPT